MIAYTARNTACSAEVEPGSTPLSIQVLMSSVMDGLV